MNIPWYAPTLATLGFWVIELVDYQVRGKGDAVLALKATAAIWALWGLSWIL